MRRGRPGRRKRQAAKLLDPACKDWWQNMDVNLFGTDVEHPWLDLACTVKTIQLQDEEDRRAGTPTRNERWRSQKVEFLRKEFGSRATEAALAFNGKPFHSFAPLLESFKKCKKVPPADSERTVLMIYHELFKLIHGIPPGYLDLWEVLCGGGKTIKGKNIAWIPRQGPYNGFCDVTFGKGKEFPLMDESQLRRTCTKMGLSLAKDQFLRPLEKEYAEMESQLKRYFAGTKFKKDVEKAQMSQLAGKRIKAYVEIETELKRRLTVEEFKKIARRFTELANLTPSQLESLCDRLPHRITLRHQAGTLFLKKVSRH